MCIEKRCWCRQDNQYHGFEEWTFDRTLQDMRWVKIWDSDQTPTTMVKSRNPLFPDLEISERHIDWNFGWFEISENDKNGNDFESYALIGLLSGYYYRDSVQNIRVLVVVLEVAKVKSIQTLTKSVWKVMKANTNATICLVANSVLWLKW